MYLKINGEEERYSVSLHPFTSQHGKRAVRFKGDEVPETDKGFTYYNEDGTVAADLSDYKYPYRPNEFTTEEDVIVLPAPNNAPAKPSALDIMNQRINSVANSVAEITPYTETKTAYFGENEKVFYGVPNGNISIFFDNYTGEYETNRIEDRITIKFPARLTDMTSITVMVQ